MNREYEVKFKQTERDEIAKETKEFLKNGGKIQRFAPGYTEQKTNYNRTLAAKSD